MRGIRVVSVKSEPEKRPEARHARRSEARSEACQKTKRPEARHARRPGDQKQGMKNRVHRVKSCEARRRHQSQK